MQSLERIIQDERSTLVAQYTPSKHTNSGYQSEAALEAEFIAILELQGYEYVPIKSEEALIENLKKQLEALNNITFSPSEWQRFFKEVLCRASDGIIEKTTLIQEQEIQVLKRDDGCEINIKLLDKNHIYNNRLQVINQYAVEGWR